MERLDWDNGNGSCNNQDEMVPEIYAQAYHEIYTAIKSVDPTAQVAIGGMVEFSDLRSQYLERVWNEYSRLYGQIMPVDVWNIHLYVLSEGPNNVGAGVPAGFSETSGVQYAINDNKDFTKAWPQIVSLRTWMKNHGQQNKPLIISEYGVNFPAWMDPSQGTYTCPTYPDTTGCPFSPEQVRDRMMYPSFDTFLKLPDPQGLADPNNPVSPTYADIGYPADGNRLVQRWNWFSIDYDYVSCDAGLPYERFGGSLFHSGLNLPCSPSDFPPPLGLSPLGVYWEQYVQSLP
jgi:hypothetical protein